MYADLDGHATDTASAVARRRTSTRLSAGETPNRQAVPALSSNANQRSLLVPAGIVTAIAEVVPDFAASWFEVPVTAVRTGDIPPAVSVADPALFG